MRQKSGGKAAEKRHFCGRNAAPRITSPKETPSGENLKTVRYYAKVKLADGSYKTSRKVIVHHYCPDFKASIKLPKGADGITRTSFGLKDAIHAEIELSDGAELSDVVWNMGDKKGTTYKGLAITHPRYEEYGEYTISVSCKCKNCGKAYSPNTVKVTVEKQPVKAFIDILEKGSYYTVGSKLHLVSRSTGDIEDLVWTIDGVELTEFRGKPEAIVHASKKPCEMLIGLQALGPAGTEPSTATRDVRVRFGWWLILLVLIGALIGLGLLAHLLLNNGPAGWKIKFAAGRKPNLSDLRHKQLFVEDFMTGFKPRIIRHFWSVCNHCAVIRLDKLAKCRKFSVPDAKDFVQYCTSTPAAAIKIARSATGNASITAISWPRAVETFGLDPIDAVKRFAAIAQTNNCPEAKKQYLFVAVDTSSRDYRYGFLFIVLVLGVLALAAWITVNYAI